MMEQALAHAMTKLATKLLEWTGYGLVAASGAAIHYLYVQISTARPFSGARMVIHMLMAFWMGVLFSEVAAPEYKYTLGWAAVVGYCTQHILAFIETRAVPLAMDAVSQLVVSKIRRLLGMKTGEDE